jgi:hypothetical protein
MSWRIGARFTLSQRAYSERMVYVCAAIVLVLPSSLRAERRFFVAQDAHPGALVKLVSSSE